MRVLLSEEARAGPCLLENAASRRNDASCSCYRIKEFRVAKRQLRNDYFTSGELSRRTGVNIETIRYYERIGLMPPPPRTQGGHRAYTHDGLRTLVFIRRARELGFGIDDVRALLSLRAATPCCMDVKSIAVRHLEAVRSKLRDLVELETVLSETITRCPGDKSSDCPVLDILDAVNPDALQPFV